MKLTRRRLYNETRGVVLAERVFAADGFFSRLRGLIGYPSLDSRSALWIEPCQQVHTHFMRWPLRVVFVDRDLRVVGVIPELRPWRVSPWVRSARSVVELGVESDVEIVEGDRLAVG
jgi:uncharacterized membrane protein (UPF0127 family)